MQNPMFDNNELMRAYAGEFVRIFKVPLRPFMSPYIGFDVVKFDDEVLGDEDRSVLEVIREKFGEEGVTLMQAIIIKEAELLDTKKSASKA